MRTVSRFSPVVAALALVAGLTPQNAASACVGTLGPSLASTASNIKQITVPACAGTAPTGGPLYSPASECDTCKSTLDNLKKEIPQQISTLGASDTSLACQGAATITAAGDTVTSNQKGGFLGSMFGNSQGEMAKQQQTDNALAGQAWFKKCQKTVNDSCKAGSLQGTPMRSVAERFYSECGGASTVAGAAAGKNKSDSLNLGDLAKQTGNLAGLMGAAAQLAGAMNRGNQSGISGAPDSGSSDATAPTGSNISSSSGPETTSLGASKTALNSANLGTSDPAVAASASGAPSGAGGSAAATGGSSPSKFTTGGSSGFGADGSGGAVGASMKDAGMGLGTGSSSSSGASRPGGAGREPASGGTEAGLEVGAGGLSNRAKMMGLKPGGEELADLAPAAEADAKLDPIPGVGNARDAEASAANSVEAGESIFERVRRAYGSLAKRGRF